MTAIKLFSDVGVVCHQEAREVFNVMAGDIESLNQDKKHACVSLSYTHLTKGLLIKRGEAVSFILAATLELETA
ncbi:TPA: hypothetical protein O4I98_001340 [Vibrio parahaemolyticus]|nr:hypothetical protein [Vibrio parahaemolyticus]